MNSNEVWDIVDKNIDWFISLYDRWQDEKEYEDINDYMKVIKEKIPDIYAMSKRPFGFKADTSDGKIHIKFITKGSRIQLAMVSI